MSPQESFVSVIVPVHNGAKFLAEAVASIRQQSYQPLEIIIVDDGSTDETAELVPTLGQDIQYTFQANSGPGAARNTGLTMAQGDLITFLDVDDLWPPEKLHTQVRYLKDDPSVDVVLGKTQFIRLPGAIGIDMQPDGPDHTMVNVYLGSSVFRNSVFDKVGQFDETLRYSEDHDWFLRAREKNISIRIIETVTLYYRLHASNMTRDKNAQDLLLTKVLKMSLDRRRKQSQDRSPRDLPDIFSR